jgi:long-chain acyl-CoA synthetase
MSLNLAHYLQMRSEAHPEKMAVIFDDYRVTYGELQAYVNRVANILVDRGIQKGDKVAVMVPNTPFFPILYYGILAAGATVVPINVLLKAHEIQYFIEDSDAKVFFAARHFYQEAVGAFQETDTCHHFIVVNAPDDTEPTAVGELLTPLAMEASPEFDFVDTMPDDTAVILYTSGTTGHPKGAELTHFNMFFNAQCVKDRVMMYTADDVSLAVLPLFHSFGQTCIMNATLMAGATMSMMLKFEMPRIMEIIRRDKVSVLAAVPTMYFFMLNGPGSDESSLSTIRMLVSGGAALPVDVLNRFENRYQVRILEGYGLSETSPVASFNILERPSKAGSIGLPIWGCEMKVMCEDGSFAQTGEVGEIVIRGHNVMKGYYKKPAATEEAIVDGWFHTGDMARVDEEGYFFIVDRKKDLIIRSGMNIYPREIEEHLYAHPAVLEAAVIGVPDPARGEEVRAYITLKEGAHATEDELRDYCLEHMAKFKVPREILFLPSLPKGATGKILKRELRAQILDSI